MEITNFTIYGLFGLGDYSINIEDNKLILISENGSGKTTIVNILYFYLSDQWHRLIRYNFKKITVTVSGKKYELERDSINSNFEKILKKNLNRNSSYFKNNIEDIILYENLFEMRKNPSTLEEFSLKYGISERILNSIIEDTEPDFQYLLEKDKSRKHILEDSKILFLPTYRRIEQELNLIVDFNKLDQEPRFNKRRRSRINNKSYFELVEFGMGDVEALIRSKMEQLESNLSEQLKNDLSGKFLRDIINNMYKSISINEISNFNEDALENILERMDDSVLTKTEKDQIRNYLNDLKREFKLKDNDDAIKAHFIYRLLTIYNDLKKEEEDIINLLNVLQTYIKNKYFFYNTNKFSITVHPIVNSEPDFSKTIKFMDLSSGEKQIVSLFSHIYLSKNQKFFLIIDEPELSLSVPWQKKFLIDITNGNYCSGLIAVTHSPFIIQNELEKYAHSLNEFFISSEN
ncbi:AAA family ATPase (plasmid) [Leptospira interrogans]|uniref:AAA family ATPase n=1 Tax=Leptospira interrogans TaxID=173 RepID=UPI000347FF06|nr:AAA family ATPase [Leptospira interrogans]ULG90793.1 AAA family ATPase [Leptospira interrogans]UML82815.1 AAA family ATPase [Leptospira interrogans]